MSPDPSSHNPAVTLGDAEVQICLKYNINTTEGVHIFRSDKISSLFLLKSPHCTCKSSID